MKDKTNIPALAVLILIFAFIICACSYKKEPQSEGKVLENSAFVVESGPEMIGRSSFWVVKHKESGQRFIHVSSNVGIYSEPLK